ncbi:MAG: hypothetical protein U5L09_19035 [Bacteroidales bacterium]|nr:hypothetical protein [Bacteroidales bacterium]
MKGLPKVHIGGMGIDISPVNPDVLYLIMEAAEDKGGFFRSTDRGESWERRSDHHSSGQYYNEKYSATQKMRIRFFLWTTYRITHRRRQNVEPRQPEQTPC